MRRLRGLEILARGGQISIVGESCYLVRSQKGNGTYKVEWKNQEWTCECPDFSKRGIACKHIFAVTFLKTLPHLLSINPVPPCLMPPTVTVALQRRVSHIASQ